MATPPVLVLRDTHESAAAHRAMHEDTDVEPASERAPSFVFDPGRAPEVEAAIEVPASTVPMLERVAVAEPLDVDPVHADPVHAEPIAAEPVAAVPIHAVPIHAEPVAAEPVVLHLPVVIAEPVVREEPVAPVATTVVETPTAEPRVAVAPAAQPAPATDANTTSASTVESAAASAMEVVAIPAAAVVASTDAAPAAESPAVATESSNAQSAPVPTPATPQEAPKVDTTKKAATPALTKDRFALHGSWNTRYRLRDSGDARDQDVYSVLAIDAGDATRDRVTARVLARLSADVDGQGDAQTQATFGSLQDTHGTAAHFDLYEASVNVRHPFEAPLDVRIGRQIDYATPEFANFDGVRVQTDPLGRSKIVAGAYGGVPVRLYEATSIGDQIAGVWTEARPWTGGRLRADWMYVHQDNEPTSYNNDLLGLSLWQRLGEHVLVDGGYTRLESQDRDVRLRATWDDGQGDWMVQAGFYRLLNPLRDFASEFDPFYSTLQQYEPYTQYRMLISKALGKRVRVDVGGDVRRLNDSGDEGRLNHDYERGYATVVVSDVLTKDLDLSLTGDTWNSDGQDVRTWGVDLTWKPNTSWRLSAGSAYALYKYDVVSDVERDDVRTWYARVRKVLSSAWTVDFGYDYENGNFDDYQVITAGATWHF